MPRHPGTAPQDMARNEALDYLRGLAVLMVLLAHWGSMGASPSFTASLLRIAVVPESGGQDFVSSALAWWTSLASSIWPLNINFASGGVLLFFLVSGFVIPMSVEKHSPLSFGIRRACRLLPTLWVAILCWLVLNFFLREIGYVNEQPFTFPQILANMFLVHDWFWIPHLDLGFWTLAVEVKFYMMMTAAVVLSGRITLQTVAGLTGFLLFLSVPFADLPGKSDYSELLKLSGQSGHYWVFYFYRVLNNSTPYLIYMLMGTVIFLFQQGRIQAGVAFVSCAALFALFATAFVIGPAGAGQLHYVGDGLKALVIFAFATIRDRHGFLLRPLSFSAFFFRFFGKISYTLYLIHSLFGMSVIYAFWIWSGSVDHSILVGGTLVLGFAVLVNRYVEEPSRAVGAKIAKSVCAASFWSMKKTADR